MGDREIRLGSKVKDPITGIEGIVVNRTTYLFDTTQVAVEGDGTDGEGKRHELAYFAEDRVAVLQTPEERIGVA